MTSDWSDGEATYHDESQTKIVKDARTGLWYPVQFKYFRTKDGVQTNHELVDVQVHSLNEPIDPRLLTKKSLNVPAGTTVMLVGDSDGASHYWDGDNVMRVNSLAAGVIVHANEDDNRLRGLLGAANAAFLGMLLLFWVFKKRRHSGV